MLAYQSENGGVHFQPVLLEVSSRTMVAPGGRDVAEDNFTTRGDIIAGQAPK
jgi:hypothetical protein